jgi:hypothetical protein
LPDPGLRALGDFEDEIDAVVGKLDNLRVDTSMTVMVSRPPCMVGRTSWNRPVAKSALTPSSIWNGSSWPFGPARKYERMVSASTRWLPWTAIELTVCA